MIKLNKTIIFLLSVIAGFVSAFLFSMINPLISFNEKCTSNAFAYGGEICTSTTIPAYWQVTNDTIISTSLLFGIFCSVVTALFLLIKEQRGNASQAQDYNE